MAELQPGGEVPTGDRRARVRAVLEKRHLDAQAAPGTVWATWLQERFIARARALFYARLMFLTMGLLIFSVPIWRNYFGIGSPVALGGYVAMLLYSIANYLVLDHPRAGRVVTYITLCLDLAVVVVLIAKPQYQAGLQSPLLATQLLFTTLFALLYPKPLSILPPMLALLITLRLDQLLDRTPTAVEVLTLLWYLALNFIILYVLVYLNEREISTHREVLELQGDLKELAIVEERNRLAREIHDGLGASLSSLIIQSEYLLGLAQDPTLKHELGELRGSAEEAIEELRRSLQMMREDFDLASGLEDYVKTFRERTQLAVTFSAAGTILKVNPEAQLALFRVLQECLSNSLKHASPSAIEVRLAAAGDRVALSVKDDGKGFELAAKRTGHYGLINMRERANKVGGEVIIESKPGAGTQVTFSIPQTPIA